MASMRASRQQQQQAQLPPHGSSASTSSSYTSRAVNAQSVRSKATHASSRRSTTPTSRSHSLSSSSDFHFDNDPGRVRVAVRLRPKNAEDLILDADFADCVELQPELNRLKFRKNNWSSESYKFDEVFAETASQKRIYEAVAKPVVEGVLDGYNGTVMAYGQTGTGKTYTVARLGRDDVSERGIMVRALEDIINSTISTDSVEISYLQLYMESIQDLLFPEKINLPINEDPRSGEVSIPGATVVKIQNLNHFIELLQIGEVNRRAANTKQNTESSRSHAILMVYVRRPIHQDAEDEIFPRDEDRSSDLTGGNGIPRVRKSKLLIVDLAGSERLDKSGSEGQLLEEAKFINLSLTSLGKCINALAENSSHIPTRDSKLTRLLRDSFGGSARTSLIITIGPSARHHAETASTIMFGQRAMKIVNVVKLKEEFDYESLCRKLEKQVDNLTAEIERQQKLRENENSAFERKFKQNQDLFAEAKHNLVTRSELLEKENGHLQLKLKEMLIELEGQKAQCGYLNDKVAQLEINLENSQKCQLENSMYQKLLADTTQMYEDKILELVNRLEDERSHSKSTDEQLALVRKLLDEHQRALDQHQVDNSTYQKALADSKQVYEMKIADLTKQLDDERVHFGNSEQQLDLTQKLFIDCQKSLQQLEVERSTYQKALADNTQMYENKIRELVMQLEDKHARFEQTEEQLYVAEKLPRDHQESMQELKEIDELKKKSEEMNQQYESSHNQLQTLKSAYENLLEEKSILNEELCNTKQRLLLEEKQKKSIEYELGKLKKNALETHSEFEKSYTKESINKGYPAFGSQVGFHKFTQRESLSGQRATIAKFCEEVGLQKILQLLSSEDSDVQIHAVKVIANLAAEDSNQEKIVEEGGLDALLMLLKSSQNTTILRVASGAIANLAMNEMNQGLVMSRGGAQLLAKTASRTDDPQTLRMVAGALANLCGNEKLHKTIIEEGGINALLAMTRSGNNDVIAQVARGLANFAKCESRGIIKGYRKGRSVLIDEGVLQWLVASSDTPSSSARRHIELAICHLGQNEDNVEEFASSGGLEQLVRISIESNREDIRNLAKRTLKMDQLVSRRK
ncbi:hypothetical protein K2173_020613 [Erythroxylum novogranatense]|uniref:Kinesin motor domain-containing protein n=1 Tax=Erythroxylum novogranatense TaxID=1862640 RepID=A0AAV8TH16_9ROSI|nr:hypothetical protein K2173_020613 [Erythroxylum novogranatense]